jgi:hypothetical protein
MLATWLAFVFGFAVLAYLDAGRWPDWRMLQDILGASLVISASGGTAMESGKQAFLEAVENRLPPRLPET